MGICRVAHVKTLIFHFKAVDYQIPGAQSDLGPATGNMVITSAIWSSFIYYVNNSNWYPVIITVDTPTPSNLHEGFHYRR